jgi:hypothetical protein
MNEGNLGSRSQRLSLTPEDPRRSKLATVIEAGSQRRPAILRHCEQYLKSLVTLYETTDPKHGEESEQGKLEAARQGGSIATYQRSITSLAVMTYCGCWIVFKSSSNASGDCPRSGSPPQIEAPNTISVTDERSRERGRPLPRTGNGQSTRILGSAGIYSALVPATKVIRC